MHEKSKRDEYIGRSQPFRARDTPAEHVAIAWRVSKHSQELPTQSEPVDGGDSHVGYGAARYERSAGTGLESSSERGTSRPYGIMNPIIASCGFGHQLRGLMSKRGFNSNHADDERNFGHSEQDAELAGPLHWRLGVSNAAVPRATARIELRVVVMVVKTQEVTRTTALYRTMPGYYY
ncbi:hypothetical protein EXIGLDRAFT_706875 [Exidia glandulosa HHB12029]|uniref:Uncharacterized protein n=1 Tax=Exidia glandulosa HHB12029 TaxID=1314781 RepID=A0A165K1J9_EXIGL|nr:hypothetical protein EXIGLDRAFT_706875 [Exidia glandulosa HHB12029]